MKGKQLLVAINLVIKENIGNDEQLVALMRSMPKYLKALTGDFESLESEIEELKKETSLLLLELDKQERFNFISSEARGQRPEEAIFKVVGG